MFAHIGHNQLIMEPIIVVVSLLTDFIKWKLDIHIFIKQYNHVLQIEEIGLTMKIHMMNITFCSLIG